MYIQPATIDDLEVIVQLTKSLLITHAAWDPIYYSLTSDTNTPLREYYRSQITNPIRQFLLVAVEESQSHQRSILGFINGFIKPLFPWFITREVGHISFLAVSEDFRHRGIGKELERAAIQWFNDHNVPYVEVYTDEANEIGCTAWTSYGYRPFKRFLRKSIK
jgi:ribosomal protein S18 acetylase RimI-like enzyme